MRVVKGRSGGRNKKKKKKKEEKKVAKIVFISRMVGQHQP